jgi:hypothetical protein
LNIAFFDGLKADFIAAYWHLFSLGHRL